MRLEDGAAGNNFGADIEPNEDSNMGISPLLKNLPPLSPTSNDRGIGSFDTYGDRNMTQNDDMMFGVKNDENGDEV
jgi:hypothetical protein